MERRTLKLLWLPFVYGNLNQLQFGKKWQEMIRILGLFWKEKSQKNLDVSTGSAISNWYKVKTWLDQMFWQSTKNWCSVASWVVEFYAWSTIWNFFDITWPQRPLREKMLKFNMSLHDFFRDLFFQNIERK